MLVFLKSPYINFGNWPTVTHNKTAAWKKLFSPSAHCSAAMPLLLNPGGGGGDTQRARRPSCPARSSPASQRSPYRGVVPAAASTQLTSRRMYALLGAATSTPCSATRSVRWAVDPATTSSGGIAACLAALLILLFFSVSWTSRHTRCRHCTWSLDLGHAIRSNGSFLLI
jgi:hypothetical protein